MGERAYYSRFGFRPGAEFGLCDEYGRGPAFQVNELMPCALPRGTGLVRSAPEFAAVGCHRRKPADALLGPDDRFPRMWSYRGS
jgi:hypothetical protein